MLNRLFASKSFYYFDSYAQLQNQKLNWVEVILRKLGFFKHTHLNEVVKKGYEYTLNGRFIAKTTKEKVLINLFSKSTYEHKLPDYVDSNGDTTQLALRYISTKSKIDLIHFKVNNETLNFSKKDEKYVITVPSYEGKVDDTQEIIIKRFNSKDAKTISRLISLVIQDSSASPLTSYFRLHISNYNTLPYSSVRPLNANAMQANELQDLNFLYERTVNSKISFCPKGKPLNYKPTLSLSFGFNNL